MERISLDELKLSDLKNELNNLLVNDLKRNSPIESVPPQNIKLKPHEINWNSIVNSLKESILNLESKTVKMNYEIELNILELNRLRTINSSLQEDIK